jgi:hypothetical protein
MAVEPTQVTQTLTSPILEGSLTAFLKTLEPLMGKQINTAAYAPQIASESALQQQARTAAGGLGSLIGPDAYKQYMSPYQQEVIDTTLSEYDRQAAIQRQGIGQQAIQSGAFGGGRNTKTYGFATFGNTLTPSESVLLSNIVNQWQTDLGRNVY